MDGKAKKIYAEIKKIKLDALLVTSSSNISYLTGCQIDYGSVILFKKALYLFTDKRYSEMAKKISAGRFSVITIKEDLIKEIKKFLFQNKIIKFGFESARLKYSFYNKLKSALSGIELTETSNIVETIRSIKNAAELKNIKKAVKISDETFSFIFRYIKANFNIKITENNIAWELEKYIRENGGKNISFEIIVASGKNSSVPHHQTGDKEIKIGDLVIIDFGAVVNGYRSDLTRTVFIGKPTNRQIKIYEAVLQVQSEMIKKAKPGIAGWELDKQARDIFDNMGFSKNFLHGLGHGVGLEIHELPFLNKYRLSSEMKLKANMIFTIEPGLYIPGWGGVRIEDMVRVTASGHQVLSQAPKKLGEMIINV